MMSREEISATTETHKSTSDENNLIFHLFNLPGVFHIFYRYQYQVAFLKLTRVFYVPHFQYFIHQKLRKKNFFAKRW